MIFLFLNFIKMNNILIVRVHNCYDGFMLKPLSKMAAPCDLNVTPVGGKYPEDFILQAIKCVLISCFELI